MAVLLLLISSVILFLFHLKQLKKKRNFKYPLLKYMKKKGSLSMNVFNRMIQLHLASSMIPQSVVSWSLFKLLRVVELVVSTKEQPSFTCASSSLLPNLTDWALWIRGEKNVVSKALKLTLPHQQPMLGWWNTPPSLL